MACILAISLLPEASGGEAASSDELDRTLASEAAVVTNRAGRAFRGLLDGWRDGRLYIRAATDGGEVGYSFAPEDIADLVMPGDEMVDRALELRERGDLEVSLGLLEAVTRQRLRYLTVLQARHRQPLFACLTARASNGDPWVTIGYVNALRDFAAKPEEQHVLRDAELRAYVRIGLREETRRLATQWCVAMGHQDRSALGWAVLAQLALDEGDAERSLWIALEPIAFSQRTDTDELATCYALAIAAADALGRTQQAATLRAEMDERGIDWPDVPRFGSGRESARTPADPATSSKTYPSPHRLVGGAPL